MTNPRPTPRFDFDGDERRFLADVGLPADGTALWTACPPPALLLAAEEHTLPGEAQDRVSAHLSACEFCQSLVRDVRDAGPGGPPMKASGFWRGCGRKTPCCRQRRCGRRRRRPHVHG